MLTRLLTHPSVTPAQVRAAVTIRTVLLALAGPISGLAGCSAFAPGPAVPISEEPESGGALGEGGSQSAGADGSASIPPGPSLNGCAQNSYVDRSGDGDDRTIYFGGSGPSGPFMFFPACMVVSPGQTVTFNGDFSVHPVSPGSNPDTLTSGTAGNPITAHATNDSPLTPTFKTSGTFPFFCQNHYASGMYGAVRVR